MNPLPPACAFDDLINIAGIQPCHLTDMVLRCGRRGSALIKDRENR
jgi:hypothetical protein